MLRVFIFITILIFSGCFDSKTSPKKETNTTKKEKRKEQNITKEENETEVIQEVFPVEDYSSQQLELKSDFERYLENLRTLNSYGIIDMTYEGLFKPINRELFVHFINAILDSPEISIESFDANITNIGDIREYEKGKFANLDYRSVIKLNFVNPNLYSDELSLRVLKDVLEKKYGRENIQVDKDTRSVVIKKDEKLLAIKDNNSSSWKFIGDNDEYRKLYPEALPPELLELL